MLGLMRSPAKAKKHASTLSSSALRYACLWACCVVAHLSVCFGVCALLSLVHSVLWHFLSSPQRDVPLAVIASLLVTTVLYVGVSIVLVGMVPYTQISDSAPLSAAFGTVGLVWAETIIA